MSTRKNLRIESLEERRLLAIFIAGENYNPPGPGEEFGYVAPPQDGFAPIALPAGITPPGTEQLTPPPGGELPPDLQPMSGLAETNASVLAVGWLYTHEDAVGDVTGSGTDLSPSYSMAIEVHDGPDFFYYAVDESAAQIAARYVMRNGAHSEILASAELVGSLDGGLVYAQFEDDLLTAMAVQSEIAGATSVWTYPEGLPFSAQSLSGQSSGGPGLSSPDDLAALDALVQAHLDGPAAAIALDNFHAAVDEYFALAVPEPASVVLAAAAILPLAFGLRGKRRQL